MRIISTGVNFELIVYLAIKRVFAKIFALLKMSKGSRQCKDSLWILYIAHFMCFELQRQCGLLPLRNYICAAYLPELRSAGCRIM